SPGWKTQKIQVETKSFTTWKNSADEATSSSQNNESYRSQSERGVTGKSLESEQRSSHCKHKSHGLQSGVESPDKCSPGINIAEESIQNTKLQNTAGSSVTRTGFCVRDTPPDTVVIVDDDIDTGVSTCDVSSSAEQDDGDTSTETNTGREMSDEEVDSDDLDTVYDSSYRKRKQWFYWHTVGQSPNSSMPASLTADVSDDEDECQVFEPCGQSHFNSVNTKEKQKQGYSGRYRYISESDSDSSDCEILEDSYGEIRRRWEEAALKKRFTKGFEHKQCEAGVEASVSGSNLATNSPVMEGGPEVTIDRRDVDFEKRNAGENVRDPSEFTHGNGINVSSYQINVASLKTSKELDTGNPYTSGPNMSDGVVHGQDAIEINSCTAAKELHESGKREMVNESALENSHRQFQEEENPMLTGTCPSEEAKTESIMNENVGHWICDREKLKETAEFRFANQEEWVHRKLELQRQAKEVQQLRKRRRAEAERMLEMERRQKRRLEEIRIIQKKEEQTMDLKEQLRDQVRARLEEVASRCKDMASLLRCLGVPVEGGSLPSPQQ
ncbi:hypothetical protein KI387_001524, partial [Taxus chinensis]